MRKKKEDHLIDQFFMTLSTTYKQVQVLDEKNEQQNPITEEIEDLLTGERSWTAGYRIEQLMVSLLHGDVLEAVLSRQMHNAKKLGDDTFAYYSLQFKSAKTEVIRQTLLKQIVQQLQWYYQTARIKQHYKNNTWLIATYAFVAGFLFFFLPQILPGFDEFLMQMGGERAIDIYTAISSGALGASFSVLLGLNDRIKGSSISRLKMLQRPIFTISKIVTGFGAGLIMFYFLQSGLIKGIAFPEFTGDDHIILDGDFRSLALLIIWCFISGFSEKLVPGILSKTEEQVMSNTE
jgi:hypothetical protein